MISLTKATENKLREWREYNRKAEELRVEQKAVEHIARECWYEFSHRLRMHRDGNPHYQNDRYPETFNAAVNRAYARAFATYDSHEHCWKTMCWNELDNQYVYAGDAEREDEHNEALDVMRVNHVMKYFFGMEWEWRCGFDDLEYHDNWIGYAWALAVDLGAVEEVCHG